MIICAEKLDMVPQHGREQCCRPTPSTHTDGCSVLHPKACTSTACDISRLPGGLSFLPSEACLEGETNLQAYLSKAIHETQHQAETFSWTNLCRLLSPTSPSLSPQFFFFVFSRLPTMLSRPEHNPALGTQCLDIGYTQVERPVH